MKKKYIKWSFVIAFMIVIFMFSNQPAEISNGQSKFVLHLLQVLGIDLNSFVGELSNFIIRKIGHFSEYFILYLFVYNALIEDYSLKRSLISALIIVFLYACSDEFHQIFIPGRSAKITDVLIDTLGGTLGITVVTLRNRFYT